MYAAQQQHLMLQTAALQQQHGLSTAQLQSLAAVQQVSKRSPNVIHSLSLQTVIAVIVDLLQDTFHKFYITLSVFPVCFLTYDRPVLQLAGKALHKMVLHLNKQDLLRLQ